MSLEAKIEELTGAVTALVEIIKQDTIIKERLLAGQSKAIETVAAGNPAAPAKRGRKSKEETAADTQTTSAEPADTASGADDADSASDEAPVAAKADPKPAADAPKEKMTFSVAAKKWLDKEEQGSDAYKARGKTIMGILANFGAAKMSELEAGDEDKAMFYLKRVASGLTINFDAAYDFAGDPKQDEPAAGAAAADEDDDIFA